MKQLLIIILVFIGVQSFSQTYFNKRYDFEGVYDGALNVIETDSGYIVTGSAGNKTTLQFNIGLLNIDFQGFDKKKSGMG